MRFEGKYGMDEATYKQWWPLHYRAAVGKPLTAEEQAVYEAELRLVPVNI